MKNYVQSGNTMTWTNDTGAAVASGDVVVVGNQIGVASVDIADGDAGELSMSGVYELPKATGAAITAGDAVVWDASAGGFAPSSITPATGDVSGACTAWAPAALSATTAMVKINTGVGTVAA